MAAHKYVKQSSCIFGVTIAGFSVLDSAIGKWIFNVSVGFRQIIHTSHAEVCMSTFGNGRNNTKTACICLVIVSDFQHVLGNPALFLAQW